MGVQHDFAYILLRAQSGREDLALFMLPKNLFTIRDFVVCLCTLYTCDSSLLWSLSPVIYDLVRSSVWLAYSIKTDH